jgi:hypothetical protein
LTQNEQPQARAGMVAGLERQSSVKPMFLQWQLPVRTIAGFRNG